VLLTVNSPKIEERETTPGFLSEFVIAPLEGGFGYTLGNTLRRTLLSSIPGAAVTSVQIHQALHEFTTIPGVAEDVTALILNLKELVLTSDAEAPVTVRLDVKGPAEATGADLQMTSDVQIVNNTHHLATVNRDGRLELSVVVQRGFGYRSADLNKIAGSPIGVIPVDSIFSPVRRVSYQVEQLTERRDRLVIEIATNGALSPRDALSSADRTLIGLIEPFADLGEGLGLEMGASPEERSTSPDLKLPIEALDLTERPRNCLKRAQINTVGELVAKSEDDLLGITNFGEKSLQEVLQRLDDRGLSLARVPSATPDEE
jgi:DNA-directed RNA polymerase subunit alpha